MILQRLELGNTYTRGQLTMPAVNWSCDTIEPTWRKLKSKADKVAGQTAIPAGTYDVILQYSPKYGRIMPRLLNVPYFEGILIHSGNTAEDTRGCILVGRRLSGSMKGYIQMSRVTFAELLGKLELHNTIQILDQ